MPSFLFGVVETDIIIKQIEAYLNDFFAR